MTVSPAALRTAQHDYGAAVASGDPTPTTVVVAQLPDAVERLVPPASSAEVSGRIRVTVRQGVGIAAHDGDAEVRAFLADDKKVAMLAGGVGVVAGAQLVPGVNVAVDAGLGMTAAAMYAAAGAAHRDRIDQAVGSLHAYATEVAAADTPERQAHAAQDFARFLEVGGGEGADALGAIAGAASAPAMLAGVAAKVTELGGLDGVLAAAKNGAHAAHASVTNGIRAAADRLDDATHVGGLQFASIIGAGKTHSLHSDGTGQLRFARATNPEAVNGTPIAARGERVQAPSPQAFAAAARNKLNLSALQKMQLCKASLPQEGELPFEPPKHWDGSRQALSLRFGSDTGFRDIHGNVWLKGPSRTKGDDAEWDVQIAVKGARAPEWIQRLSRDGAHVNVAMSGKVTH